jgi:hypothetical protein
MKRPQVARPKIGTPLDQLTEGQLEHVKAVRCVDTKTAPLNEDFKPQPVKGSIYTIDWEHKASLKFVYLRETEGEKKQTFSPLENFVVQSLRRRRWSPKKR